jgi:hypothetical protein
MSRHRKHRNRDRQLQPWTVTQPINFLDLSYRLNDPIGYSKEEQLAGTFTLAREGVDQSYLFIPRGGKVLGIAHLDSHGTQIPLARSQVRDDVYWHHSRMDDRLGVYVIMDLLPRMGIVCDVLLTTGEEIGRSTGKDFALDFKGCGVKGAPEAYNWIFSFDREGDQAVLYQYMSKEWTDTVQAVGFPTGRGTFSDITSMGELGVKGLNVGTGLCFGHSSEAFFKESVFQKNLARFRDFYFKNVNTHFPHTEYDYAYNYGTGWGAHSAGWYDDDDVAFGKYNAATGRWESQQSANKVFVLDEKENEGPPIRVRNGTESELVRTSRLRRTPPKYKCSSCNREFEYIDLVLRKNLFVCRLCAAELDEQIRQRIRWQEEERKEGKQPWYRAWFRGRG